MLYGGILKEGGQIPKYRIPVISGILVSVPIPKPFFYEFRHRVPIPDFRYFRFGSVSVSVTDT